MTKKHRVIWCIMSVLFICVQIIGWKQNVFAGEGPLAELYCYNHSQVSDSYGSLGALDFLHISQKLKGNLTTQDIIA